MQSEMEERSWMAWCHEMRKCLDENKQERKRCEKEIDFQDRNITGRECNSETTEDKGMCQWSRRREKRYFSPIRFSSTLRSNSVICQPHRQYGWLMDWEGMRDTSSGNPCVVICSRHYQTYLLRAGWQQSWHREWHYSQGWWGTWAIIWGLEEIKDYCNLITVRVIW